MRRASVLLASVVLSGLLLCFPASASLDPLNDGGQASAGSKDGGGEISAQRVEERHATHKGGAPTVKNCVVQGIADALLGGLLGYSDSNFVLSAEHPLGYQTCKRISDGAEIGHAVWWSPPGPTAIDAVAIAESELHLRLPDIATSPPRSGLQLVGVPIWFWSVGATPVSTTAAIPGLSATLTATPVETRIRIGGGTGRARVDNVTLHCPDGGRPWQRGRDGAWANSGCSHAFAWNETFTVTATITWELAWTATNGQAGTLPDVARTTSFTLDLDQAQAVTD